MAGSLWLLLGFLAICHAARPTGEHDGASVKASGHLVAEHRAGSTKEGRKIQAPGADSWMNDLEEAGPGGQPDYDGRESPALDAPAQQQMGIIPFIERNGGAAAYKVAQEMGRASPVDRYLSASDVANSSAPWPGNHIYTPNFEAFIHKNMHGIAAPIILHARDVVGKSADAYHAITKAQRVGKKLNEALHEVHEQTSGIDKQITKETNEVKTKMQNGFEAYNDFAEQRGKLKDRWRNVAQLSDRQLMDEGERLGKSSQDFNLWDQELGSAGTASLAPLLNKEDSWVYVRKSNRSDAVQGEEDDGMEWQPDAIERRTGVEGNDLDVFPGEGAASMDGVSAPYGKGQVVSKGGSSSRGSDQGVGDDGILDG